MKWLDCVSNPKAIIHLYDEVPPLDDLEVTSIRLKSAGPTLTFSMDFPRFADHKPQRWDKECNTVSVELDFFAVKSLHLDGFTPMQHLGFRLSREGGLISVLAVGKDCQIDFSCLDVYIQKVSGYVNSER